MSPLRRATARTVQISAHGGLDTLQIVEIERPTPGPGEVLIEVLAAGINHVEAYLREGRYSDEHPVKFPIGQGTDFAGLVAAVGEGVTSFSKGSEVIAQVNEVTAKATHAVFGEQKTAANFLVFGESAGFRNVKVAQ